MANIRFNFRRKESGAVSLTIYLPVIKKKVVRKNGAKNGWICMLVGK